MATKAEIADELRRTFGKSYISITDVAKCTGVNWEQGRRYLVSDVAKMLFVKQVRM